MTGVEEAILSFAISYIAGSIPTIKDYFSRNKGLKERMSACYNRAVEQWTKSVELQDSMRDNSYRHLSDLCTFLRKDPHGQHPRHKELMRLWVNELRNDQLCYNFILEKQQELALDKQDQHEAHLDRQDEMLQDIWEKLNKNTNPGELKLLITTLIKENISELVEQLRFDEANKIIAVIDSSHVNAIKEDKLLYSEFELQKGQVLGYRDRKESIKAIQIAFENNPDDIRIATAEAWQLLSHNQNASVKKIIERFPNNNKTKLAISVALEEKPQEKFLSLSEDLQKDYTLRQLILQGLQYLGKRDNVVFLFSGENPILPEELNRGNLNAWLYILNYYRLKNGDAIIYRRDAPMVNNFREGFEAYGKFFSLLSSTDIKDQFNDLRALFCYWGFFAKGDNSFLAEFQNIDGLKSSAQKENFTLMEAAMLLIAGKEQEVFATMMSIKGEMAKSDMLMSNYTTCLTYMALNTGSQVYLNWMFEVAKEAKYKLGTEPVKTMAMFVSNENASSINTAIQNVEFVNSDEKNVIIQLCHYIMHVSVDTDSLKNSIEHLDDTLVAFAALILAGIGEEEYAYKLLNPKVDKDKVDIKQRIFLEVLSKSQVHRPELYRLLKKNRSKGYSKETILLVEEFNLAELLGDLNDALETIAILYDRNPDGQFEFANLIT